MLTPAMALTKAIDRAAAAAVMYRPLPVREGLMDEVADQFRRRPSTGRTTIPPSIRVKEIWVNPAMREALLKALSD